MPCRWRGGGEENIVPLKDSWLSLFLVEKKWSGLLEEKREHRLTLGTLCDVLEMKWFRVRGWGNTLGNDAACGESQ